MGCYMICRNFWSGSEPCISVSELLGLLPHDRPARPHQAWEPVPADDAGSGCGIRKGRLVNSDRFAGSSPARQSNLIRIIVMVAFRSFCYFGLVAFLPLYYQQQNISLIAGSHYLSLMLFAGAVGGLIGGYISDIIGRKPVIVDSLILTTVPFLNRKIFLLRNSRIIDP